MTEEFTKAEIEKARILFAGNCDFVRGVASLDQLPDAGPQEIAFAGRSNVGKSSLVNALTGRKVLARVSHTPGRTQQLNFFDLGGKIHLVDMPGYGYAKVSKAQKEEWDSLIREYLRGRPTLRCVFILIDARHGIKPNDLEIMKMLDETAVCYRIVLTKADKTKQAQRDALAKNISAELKKHGAAMNEILFTSSHGETGIEELRAVISRFIA